MICLYCASELPTGALFCGECGRSVTAKLTTTPLRSRSGARPRSGMQQPIEPESIAPETTPAVRQEPSTAPLSASPADAPAVPVSAAVEEPRPAAAPDRVPTAAPEPQQAVAPDPRPTVVPSASPFAPTVTAHDVPSAAEARPIPPVPSPPRTVQAPAPFASVPVTPKPVVPAQDTAAIEPIPWADLEPMEIDLEETRIVRKSGARFVLQFSTGESVSVTGTGLIGRNPVPEPGERFDSIVIISDAGKSVSKTHLEFGQDAGTFWISDRFSGNGTTVREPGGAPRRCDAGKRYRITRGARVDIGEQFFIVS